MSSYGNYGPADDYQELVEDTSASAMEKRAAMATVWEEFARRLDRAEAWETQHDVANALSTVAEHAKAIAKELKGSD